MKKEHLYAIVGGAILAVVLLSGECFGKSKHVLVKLKGGVLVASHRVPNTKPAIQQSEVAIDQTTNSNPRVKKFLKVNKQNIIDPTETSAPVVKVTGKSKASVIKKTDVAVSKSSYHQSTIDNLHTQITELYPGTFIDSVRLVNQLLNDSLRNELAKVNTNERQQYLKLCLLGSVQDSVTLSQLNEVSSGSSPVGLLNNGILIAHCKDAANSDGLDSVNMDVFSGSTLMASASSNRAGTIQCKGIPDGNYYVVFSRNS